LKTILAIILLILTERKYTIQQGHMKLIKSDSKDIYSVKYFFISDKSVLYINEK